MLDLVITYSIKPNAYAVYPAEKIDAAYVIMLKGLSSAF